MPVDYFLTDPPHRIDAELEARLGLGNIGVKLIEQPDRDGNPSGIWNVWDIVGKETHYPNVADFIQETRSMGISRRIESGASFELLTAQSRLILLHRKAWIDNYHDYYGALNLENTELRNQGKEAMASDVGCPRRTLLERNLFSGDPHSVDPEQNATDMCLGIVFDDVDGGETLYDPGLKSRTVRRTIGDTTYLARHRPDGVTPEYGLAIFARFPIAQIDVIRDLSNGVHHERIAKARTSKLPVFLEDE